MTYRDLWEAKEALAVLGRVKKTAVAIRTKRILEQIGAEIARFMEHVRDAAGEDATDEALDALANMMADREVPDLELNSVDFDEVPEDTLDAFQIAILESIGVLTNVPTGDE